MTAKRLAAVVMLGVSVLTMTLTLFLAGGTLADHVWPGSFAKAVNLNGDSLNIRACAGMGCRVIGSIPEGSSTYIKGDAVYANGLWWYPHDFRGTVGYSVSLYLRSGNEGNSGGGGGAVRVNTGAASGVAAKALAYAGTPYVYGGVGPGGWDCSGFTQWIYQQYGVNLPRSAYDQWNVGSAVSRDNLRPGDLVFFAGTWGPGVSHVGIYIGDGKMINAQSERAGTAVANVFDAYWGAHYAGARRVM